MRLTIGALAIAALIGAAIGAPARAGAQSNTLIIQNDGVSQSNSAAGASNTTTRPAVNQASKAQKDKTRNPNRGQRNSSASPDNGGGAANAPADQGAAGQGAADQGVSDFAPQETAPTSDATGSETAPIKLPNTGAGDQVELGIAVGLATLSAIAAAAAVAARRIRIAG
jgi:LPXTG-motif cell wall-anchored protein